MDITIRRIHKNEVSLDGWLSIGGERICDTAECRENALPAGEYPIEMVRCKQYGKRCLCAGTPDCEACRQLKSDWVSTNSVMPRVCPMLKMGNGVIGRADGSIIVGKRAGTTHGDNPAVSHAIVWGTLIHPREAYERVFERIRKNLERGHDVTLRVM